MTPEKLWDLQRIGDVAVSSDGKQLAYLVTKYSLAENSGTTSLMLQALPAVGASAAGKTSIAFDTPLVTATAKALLSNVSGLQSLSWMKRPQGERLL